ncbi:MAG: hypothetical protein RLY93_20480 [Sumerlaeia bacterium]
MKNAALFNAMTLMLAGGNALDTSAALYDTPRDHRAPQRAKRKSGKTAQRRRRNKAAAKARKANRKRGGRG